MNQIDHAARWIGPGTVGFLSCAVILVVVACTPDSDRPLTGPQAVARGAEVFDYNCGYCHGADGRGPALSEIKSLSNVERRNRIINHPVSGQIPQRLKANELSDLNEFFESQ